MDRTRKQKNVVATVAEVTIDANGNIVYSPRQDAGPSYYSPYPYTTPPYYSTPEAYNTQKDNNNELENSNLKEEGFNEEVASTETAEKVFEQAEALISETTNEKIVEKPKFFAKTFAEKVIDADESIQDRYDEVKNYALRFKKLKARISRKFDSINKGRLQFIKLSVAGKTLKLYLNMDITLTNPKFHCKDMSDKITYVTVPVLLRIKSGRAVRYAKILIDQCAELHGLVENKKFKEVDAVQMCEDYLNSKKQS